MKIAAIDTLKADAGWRNYDFVKITCEDGTVGWAEFNEGFGAPGVGTVIRELAPRLIGQSVNDHERAYALLYCATRPAAGGVTALGLGAIENAMLDAKAKRLGVPVYELLGGKVRDKVRVYWSHCDTWRITRPEFYPPAITSLDDVKAMGREVREKGFTALKTNLAMFDEDGPQVWRAGFGAPFAPELNVERKMLRGIREHLEAFREGAGPDIDILLDLNFNARTEGYIRILREIADLGLFWVEIDNYDAKGLRLIRDRSTLPISSCETLLGLRDFMPFFNERAMDVAIIDAVWNGVWQSMKIAAVAEAHEMNVAPHNFYGHLCSMQNLHFCAAVPNLRIMEIDVDRLAWDDELFTVVPKIVDGYLTVPDTPGWGTEPDEAAIRAHPPRGTGGLMSGK
ncbi:MAG: mandelate racemase/muconate lactonizing enzyme family protein [Burkholderiaceae bacterium]|nr:mandelate racemase/muconate lactonizing enzyme family protein [Burkholderiaceae bacterium]